MTFAMFKFTKSHWMAATAALLLTSWAAQPCAASVQYNGGVYLQDFDGSAGPALSTTQGAFPQWFNNITLPDWYAFSSSTGPSGPFSTIGNYFVEDDAITNPVLQSWGPNRLTFTSLPNPNSVQEQALGSSVNGGGGITNQTLYYGVALENITTTTFTEFTLSYDGEQWGKKGNTNPETLAFSYAVQSSLTPTGLVGTGFNNFTGLDFTSTVNTPVTQIGSAAPLAISAISDTVTNISWAPGQILWLRWLDVDEGGTGSSNPSHILAIDNVRFSTLGEPGVVPEPMTLVVWSLLIGVVGIIAGRRR